MAAPVKVGLLAEYPMPVIYGGLEIYCARVCSTLAASKDFDVQLVDYHNPLQTFDILHIIGNPPSAYEVAIHAAKTRKVVFSTVFGGAVRAPLASAAIRSFSWAVERFGQKIDHTRVRDMFKAADHLTALNRLERDFIIERYGIAPEKITIVPAGVEDRFVTSTKTLFAKTYGLEGFVLFTGNILPRKNPLRLALALKELGMGGVFIGKEVGTELGYAAEFGAVIDSSPDLLWIKGLPAEDPLIPSAYKAATALCLPSFAEGQSASTLEAMAARIPLIMADRPYAYQDCYTKVMRCDPSSVESIAEAVQETLEHPDEYTTPLPAENLYSSIAVQMENIYRQISEERK